LNILQLIVSGFHHRPVIIVGFGQVGKTTLHKTLSRHPQIATLSGAKESPYFSNTASLVYDLEFSPRSAYLTRKLVVPKKRFYNTVRRLCFETAIGPHFGLGGVIKALVLRGEIPFGKRHWCVQTFPDETAYHCILALYPQARFIYLTRNAISAIHDQMNKKIRKGVEPDFLMHATKWAQSIERFKYLTQADCALHVSFEALLHDSQETINRIQKFVGVSCQSELFRHTQMLLARSSPPETIAGAADNPGIGETSSDGCQDIFNSWPEEFRNELYKTCSHAMTELGYEMPE
jgi:hypothetical protein